MHLKPEPEPEPPPRKGNPLWMTWAIAGVATVLVVGIVAMAIANMDKGAGGIAGGSDLGAAATATAPAPGQPTEAVDELRSHMPADLRSMTECRQADAGANAQASIECEWDASAVPNFAMYRSFKDVDSMNADAEQAHKRDTPGQSCASADDFTTGGKATWAVGNQDGGTVWCYLNDAKEPVVLWTDDALHVLAGATAPAIDDWQRLLDWMTEKGRPV